MDVDTPDIKEKGGTWEMTLKPGDVVTTAVNGVIGKEFTASNYCIWQMKTWQKIQK